MISKELLSEVLDDKVREIITDLDELYKEYQVDDESGKTVVIEYYPIGHNENNIHEIAHKCKEWAYNIGFEIIESAETTRVYNNKIEVFYLTNLSQHDNFKPFDIHYLFKSCQWILENKQK